MLSLLIGLCGLCMNPNYMHIYEPVGSLPRLVGRQMQLTAYKRFHDYAILYVCIFNVR